MWTRFILFSISAVTLIECSRFRRQGFIDLSSNRCQTPRGEHGVCIAIRKCPSLVSLLVTKRQQTEIADFLRKSVCGYEGIDPKVCCPVTDLLGGNESTSSEPKEVTTAGPKNPPLLREDPDSSSKEGLVPLPGECGKTNVQHTRVVGGVNATLGGWPWMAAFGYQSSQGGTQPVFLCAGSLISDQFILTAAHCLTNRRKLLLARLGDLNLYENNDGATPIDAKISKIIVHKDYNPTTFTNDIGLLKLSQPVKFTNHIKPVCLPLSRELRDKDYVSRQPFIAGWGSISYSGPSSATLLELQLPVVPQAECKRAFEQFKTAIIDKRVLCAGFLRGGKDACRGDSGGPLMDFNNADKLFYQIGVVSYGYKCAEQGFPGIYTRVTEFADWILEQMEINSQ